MKHLILFTALTLAPILYAEEKAAPKEPTKEEIEKLEGFEPAPADDSGIINLQIDLQIIALPTETAMSLIGPLRDPAQIDKTIAKLHEMIAAKKAVLVGWPMVITKSGNRAVTENIDEQRYATEYSPATVPATDNPSTPQADPNKPETKPAAEEAAAPAKKTAAPAKEAAKTAPLPDGPVTATAFETRNTGVTLEIEPVLGPDGCHIDMQLAPQHTSLVRFEKITTIAAGKECTVEQPLFHTNKVTTNITVRDGQSTLLGTFQAGKPEGWMELFILKAAVKKIK